jgi:hypothetical protein
VATAVRRLPPSAWVLIAANLVPLYPSVAWGWPVSSLLLLYWIENVIVGILNVPRILLVAASRHHNGWGLAVFFCVHYGIFATVHGAFVYVMGGGFPTMEPAGLTVPALTFAVSHIFSFFSNFVGRGEFRRLDTGGAMMQPYRRIVVMHAVILIGALPSLIFGSAWWAVLVLTAIKIGLDVHAHRREHDEPSDAASVAESAGPGPTDWRRAAVAMTVVLVVAGTGVAALLPLARSYVGAEVPVVYTIVVKAPAWGDDYRRGVAHAEKGDYAKAITNLERVVEAAPDNRSALEWLGHAYMRHGSYDDALAVFEKLVTIAPGDGDPYFRRGTAYFFKNDRARARANYAEACRLGHAEGCQRVQIMDRGGP